MKRNSSNHVFLLSLLLIGCAESDPTPSFSGWEASVLTNTNGWMKVSEIQTTGSASVDLFSPNATCVKDNVLTFSGNEYQIAEGVTRCDKSDPTIVDSGTWALESGVLTFTPAVGEPYSFTMQKLEKIGWEVAVIEPGSSGSVSRVTTIRFVAAMTSTI